MAAMMGFTAATMTSAQAQRRPITKREPSAVDVAKTPMTDLNIARTQIPALLVEAQKRPYSTQSLDTCAQLVAAVEELDQVLGPDMDLPQGERARLSKGRIAQWLVGKFIPFRSLVREVSGAKRQQRQVADAIQAGIARRGFLKGVGSARDCPYPASPATESIIAARRADAAPEPATNEDRRSSPEPVFTADTVVQPTP
jgi:hypothetical protein